jgi:hypothetical protein
MAELKQFPDSQAWNRNETAQAVFDATGRSFDQGAGKDVDSTRGAGQTPGSPTMKMVVAVVLAVWLAAVVGLGASLAFISPAGTPPIPIAIGVTAPLIVFITAFWLSGGFRRFVTNVDIVLLAALQGWRWAGFGFISLYAYGVLPGRFAWPAGLGDMAIGFTAPLVVLALVRRPSFAGSRWFVIWNLLGILDLVAAVTNAAIFQSNTTGATGEISVAPMAQLPLLLIPAYLVPLFIMLHITALIKARRVARNESI